MLGNFSYSNPAKLYFGGDAQKNLSEELKNYDPKVMSALRTAGRSRQWSAHHPGRGCADNGRDRLRDERLVCHY